MSDSDYIKRELWEVGAFFIFIIVFFIGMGGILIATIFKGFSDPQFQSSFSLYMWMAFISGVFILALAIWNYAKGKREFIIPLHEPESAVWSQELHFNPKFLRNPILATITFSLAFMFLVYSKVVKQFSLDYLPFKSQAVAPLGNFWTRCIFPLIENLVIFAQLILIISWAKKKVYPSSKLLYYVITLLVAPALLAGEWVLFHNLVYSASAPDQLSTYFSGFLWIMLTSLFMSIIPGVVLHFFIDFFLYAFDIGWLATYKITIFIIIITIILLIGFYWVYRLNKTPTKVLS